MRFRWGTGGRDINRELLQQIKSLLAPPLAAWSPGAND